MSNQCADVSVGLGSLYINGRGVGYLKNNIEYSYDYDILKFYTGSPQILTCQFVTKLNSSLKATYAQINSANLSTSLGQLPVSSLATSAITVTTGSPQTFTPQLDPATGNFWFRISPVGNENGVVSALASVVVKDAAATLVTTGGTPDYAVDALGNVQLFSTGTYVPGDTVQVSYTGTVLAGMNINLGALFSLNEVEVMFVHTKLNSQKRVTIWIPRATVTGKINLKFTETEVILNEIILDALQSSAYPSYPFGRMFIQS